MGLCCGGAAQLWASRVCAILHSWPAALASPSSGTWQKCRVQGPTPGLLRWQPHFTGLPGTWKCGGSRSPSSSPDCTARLAGSWCNQGSGQEAQEMNKMERGEQGPALEPSQSPSFIWQLWQEHTLQSCPGTCGRQLHANGALLGSRPFSFLPWALEPAVRLPQEPRKVDGAQGPCYSDPKDIACSSTLVAQARGSENGTHRFRLQKQVPADGKTKPLDPEMQCLLLSDGTRSAHQNHIIVLPADGGGMAAISFTGALRIPGVIEFSLCLLFAKLVSYTFLFWLPLYITSVDHLDARKAGELSTLFDVGGIFGGILAGVISDRLEKRASTCGLMLLLAAPTLYIFSTISKMGLEATVAMLLLCGALVSGPYALITTAVSADLGTHKSLKGNSHALATVTAIIDGTGSVGAALGPLLAGLISPSGWNNVFYMLMFADACALLFLIRLIHRELSCPGSATGDQMPFKEH
ncbi:glucose-6-phosphate exchanger SLC37A1 isoform X3 [Manis pentadactyla]|uniref:glucose-6-phosphate exchanger SLC37A1 isoform X3 n=1 Tax=Manis pentadactyla TaxID=143292 RepID=UPI00255C851D|nr:glucose-6-phosphate exchanger SLC37A1 isoform X3 [Manis pentadactyla]